VFDRLIQSTPYHTKAACMSCAGAKAECDSKVSLSDLTSTLYTAQTESHPYKPVRADGLSDITISIVPVDRRILLRIAKPVRYGGPQTSMRLAPTSSKAVQFYAGQRLTFLLQDPRMRCVERQQICRRSEETREAYYDSEIAFLKLMSERNFAAHTTTPSALTATSPTQSEPQNPHSPSDFDSSSQPEPITVHDSSSSQAPTSVPKPQKKLVHSCPICAKHFSRSSTLSRHTQSHRGAKDHKCAVCLREFSRKDLLNRHMSLHDRGAKWVCGAYSCEGRLPEWGCGREFARVDDLKRHFGSQKGQSCMNPIPPLFIRIKHDLAMVAHHCQVDDG
jgi:hypothetical protein